MQHSLKLFWYRVFVHWKLKLLNFLMDSVLIGGSRVGARPPLLLDQTEARRAEKKFLFKDWPPNLKVWIRYVVYQACSTESLQLGKILIQMKKEEKLKDCKFANKYSPHLAQLGLWERKILFFLSFFFRNLFHWKNCTILCFKRIFPGFFLKMVSPSYPFDDWSR